MLTAMAIRFRFDNACNYLLIGSDGPYYPLQVRSILEKGRLAFPDMPLVFWLQALVAKLFALFNPNNMEANILGAIKATDILLPPLAAIPIFGIMKQFIKPGENQHWRAYLLVAYAALNVSVTYFFMASGLIKNAIAIVFVFIFLNLIVDSLNNGIKKNSLKLSVTLGLCALTHFGAFSLLLVFMGLLGLFYWAFNKKNTGVKTFGIILTIFTGSLLLLYFFDHQRFERLANAPLKIFQAPVAFFLKTGLADVLNPMVIIQVFVANGLALLTLVHYFLNRRNMAQWAKALMLALIVWTFILAFPWLGIAYANRLYLMCFVPITVLYGLVFYQLRSTKLNIIVYIALFGLLVSSLIFSSRPDRTTAISEAAYLELLSIKSNFPLPQNSLTTGRQDLRLLSSWVFGNLNKADYLLQKTDFITHRNVYILNPIKGDNLNTPRHRQMPIPSDAKALYKGDYFELNELLAVSWQDGIGKPALFRGKITSINRNKLTAQNELSGQEKVFSLSTKTKLELADPKNALQTGKSIALYGNRKAFSLDYEVELVREIQ
jgi:hypothetical protein